MEKIKILKNALVLTLNESDELLEHTDIKIVEDVITEIGKNIVPLGNEEIVAQMTMNNRRNKRYSGLRFRLTERLP